MKKYDSRPLKTARLALQKYAKGTCGFAEAESKLNAELKHLSSWLHKRNYALYLQSEEWDIKRKMVLGRDNCCCVICGAPAEHIHHLTYDRIFNEPLYDLVSVCASCHEIIHTLDKKA